MANAATRHHDNLLQDLRQLGFAAEPSELATAPLAARSWLEMRRRRRSGESLQRPRLESLVHVLNLFDIPLAVGVAISLWIFTRHVMHAEVEGQSTAFDVSQGGFASIDAGP